MSAVALVVSQVAVGVLGGQEEEVVRGRVDAGVQEAALVADGAVAAVEGLLAALACLRRRMRHGEVDDILDVTAVAGALVGTAGGWLANNGCFGHDI